MLQSDPPSLTGKVMLVTGASSGIGGAIARAAARAGADVALTFRANEAGVRDTEREVRALGRRAAVFQLDVSDEHAVRDIGPAVTAALGRIDVWVNNAGADILTGTAAALSRTQKMDLLLSVDLRGTMLASWAAVDLMTTQPDGGGVIINMSWDHVLTGMAGPNPQMYSAVKGGVLSFSKSLARSVAPRVRVHVLAPGFIETAFGEGADRAWRQAVIDSTPMRRWGTPEDVAAAAVFLASPAAGFMTGQMLMIGGGVVM